MAKAKSSLGQIFVDPNADERRIRFGCALAIIRGERTPPISAREVAEKVSVDASSPVTVERITEIELGRFDCEDNEDRRILNRYLELLNLGHEDVWQFARTLDLSDITEEDLQI